MRVSYLYFMKDEPDRVREVAPEHASYWRGLGLPKYLGGPFADRSGGVITFEAGTGEEATELVANDPFVRDGLLQRRWVKEWQVE
jgi:uncharacterized protein YciI